MKKAWEWREASHVVQTRFGARLSHNLIRHQLALCRIYSVHRRQDCEQSTFNWFEVDWRQQKQKCRCHVCWLLWIKVNKKDMSESAELIVVLFGISFILGGINSRHSIFTRDFGVIHVISDASYNRDLLWKFVWEKAKSRDASYIEVFYNCILEYETWHCSFWK